MSARSATHSGFQLIELIVALAIAAILAALTVPPLMSASSALRVELAAYELVGVLRAARSFAILRSANVAVKFLHTGGKVWFALYRDGDGDGVLNRDIDSGVDPEVAPPRPLVYLGGGVDFGFPPGPAPRDPADPRNRLDRLDDPIRFNNSDLASFTGMGEATPGSAYISDGAHRLAVVRVQGRTAKVRVLQYDNQSERWR